jgi:hypothetical protein
MFFPTSPGMSLSPSTCPTSLGMSLSPVTCHLSLISDGIYPSLGIFFPPSPGMSLSPVTCHLSPVTCHLSSPVTRHMSPAIRVIRPPPVRGSGRVRVHVCFVSVIVFHDDMMICVMFQMGSYDEIIYNIYKDKL